MKAKNFIMKSIELEDDGEKLIKILKFYNKKYKITYRKIANIIKYNPVTIKDLVNFLIIIHLGSNNINSKYIKNRLEHLCEYASHGGSFTYWEIEKIQFQRQAGRSFGNVIKRIYAWGQLGFDYIPAF